MKIYITFKMNRSCQPFPFRNNHTTSSGLITSCYGFGDSFRIHCFPTFHRTIIHNGKILFGKNTFFDGFHSKRSIDNYRFILWSRCRT